MAKIGIDIDETLSFTNRAMIKYYKKNLHSNVKKDILESFIDLDMETKLGLFHKMVLEENTKFIDPMVHAKGIIKKLDKKNKLYLITARSIKLYNPTKEWVEEHFKNIFFEDIKHVEYKGLAGVVKDKDEISKEIGIDVLIDDKLDNAEKCANQGIPVILFDLKRKYVPNKKLPKNITKAHNWKEVYNILKTKYNIY